MRKIVGTVAVSAMLLSSCASGQHDEAVRAGDDASGSPAATLLPSTEVVDSSSTSSTVAPAVPRVVSTTTTSRQSSTTTASVSSTTIPLGGVVHPCHQERLGPSALGVSRSPGGRVWVALEDGSVGISDNEGTTWTWHCGALNHTGAGDLVPGGVTARDTTHAFAWARPATDNAASILFATTDGGATWSRVTGDVLPTGADFLTETTGLVWGATSTGGPALFRIVEGSRLEPLNTTGLTGPIRRASFVDGSYGWVIASNAAGATALFTTDDGADTWRSLTPPWAATPLDLARTDDTRGCVLSDGSGLDTYHGGDVQCTADGGATWNRESLSAGTFTHLVPIGPATIMAAGSQGQIRYLDDGRMTHGTTVTGVCGVIHAISADWGRYVTLNGEDGYVLFTRPFGEQWPVLPLGTIKAGSRDPRC